MLLRSLVLTLMLAGLVMGATLAAEPEQQVPLLKIVATEAETYSLDTRSIQIRRFASGETQYEVWVRTDFDKKAYLENMELIKGSTAPQEYAQKLSHSMTRMIFSPNGTRALMEHISYGYDGAVLNNWREEEPDWQDVVPRTPGAAMLDKIIKYAEQEYGGKSPEQALMAFLTWYVEGRMRNDQEEEFPDPLMSYAYMDREDLTDNFKRDISTEMPRPGADPVLDTQWIKPVMITGTVVITGESARVSVYTYRLPNQSYQQTPLLYFLVRQDGNWLIDRVEREEPWKVVEGFYKWYKKILSEGQNPLVSGAYRQSGFLTKDFMDRLDAQVATINQGDSQRQIAPILFGYELREPRTSYCEINEHFATIFISLSGHPYDKGDRLLVTLSRVDERWKIDAITPE